MSDTCPHCGHAWAGHPNCPQCGCLWAEPQPPSPPPSDREQLIANIKNTIWTELERQAETERFGPCVDRDDDLVDGHVDMTAVAAAVAELFVDSNDDCSWCHSVGAIQGWKQPLTDN